MEVTCAICCDACASPVECPKCRFTAFIPCFKTYVLSKATIECCANCKLGFTDEYLAATCGASFVSGALKKARTQVYMVRERSLLAETQPHAAARLERIQC